MGSTSKTVIMIKTATFMAVGILSFSTAEASKKSWVCNHPDKPGGWGALDTGCDADQYGDVRKAKSLYPTLIFDRRPEGIEETQRYLTEVQAAVKEVAREYYLKRVPDAKPHTLAAWVKTAVTIAAHESKLSHYRISADNRFKLMTGDGLVSHGIMQVNQNYHANRGGDSSFDFVGNVTAALDYYFEKWSKAVEQNCWKSSLGKNPTLDIMLTNRARSAYSSYNSGSDFCRFTNLKAKWARNDSHFAETLKTQPWKKYILDENRKSPINVKCMLDGDELCAMAKETKESFVKDRPLVLADGRTCLTSDGVEYTCATDARLFSCLAKIDPDTLENDPVKIKALPENAKVTLVKDREALCSQAVEGLVKVGQSILLKKPITIREEIGGSPLGNASAGRIYQVMDFDIRLGGKSERYYRIRTPNGSEGWIYGGANSDFAEWIAIATDADKAELARADEKAKADRIAKRQAEEAAAKAKAESLPVAAEAKPSTVAPSPAIPSEEQEIVVTGKKLEDENDDDPVAVLPVRGSVIEIVRADGIVLRETAGESPDKAFLAQLYKGARLEVLEVATLGTDNRLYLKVQSGSKLGWIYAGRTAPDTTVSLWIKIWK